MSRMRSCWARVVALRRFAVLVVFIVVLVILGRQGTGRRRSGRVRARSACPVPGRAGGRGV